MNPPHAGDPVYGLIILADNYLAESVYRPVPPLQVSCKGVLTDASPHLPVTMAWSKRWLAHDVLVLVAETNLSGLELAPCCSIRAVSIERDSPHERREEASAPHFFSDLMSAVSRQKKLITKSHLAFREMNTHENET